MAATASFAQSSVEIYGIIDQSYSSLTGKGSIEDVSTKVTSTTTGNQSGLATQRIGFRGTEDLGGGLKGRFQIESSLSAGNAGTNGFGSRPTFVGLEGGFGTVLLGRQDTPLLKAVVPQLAGGANNIAGQLLWSPLNTSLIDPTATADTGFGRLARETTIDRAINYITPVFAGFNAELQYGQNSTKTDTTGIARDTDKTNDFGMNVKYANGPLTVNAATHDQKTTTNSAEAGRNKNNYVGATYDLGVVNLPSGRPTMKLTGGALERLRAITPSGHEARIEVKPSYGLSDDEIAGMLKDSLEHAKEDAMTRALKEAQVEAPGTDRKSTRLNSSH